MSLQKHDPYAALRIREFRILIFSRLAITIASQMEVIIVRYQIYGLTHDPLPLGIAGLVEAIPALFVALFAGHVADHMNRRTLIIASRGTLVLTAAGLLALSFHMPELYAHFGVMPIYGLIVISGAAAGFLSPASFAFNSEVLPKDLYANGAAWNSSTWQAGAILGPTVGGLIAGFFGISVAYVVNVVLVLVSTLVMFTIPNRPRPRQVQRLRLRESLMAGWRFVFKNQPILGSISLDLFAVLFGGAVALLPIYASDIYHVGPEGLGVLQAAPSVGAVVVSLLLAHRPLKGMVGKQILWTVAAFGVTIVCFAITTNIYLGFALLVLYGATDSVSVVIRSTVIQLLTPDNMRGRVAAVNSIFIGTSNEIGAFESGVAAKLLGTVASVVFGGLMTLGTVGLVAAASPKLRALKASDLTPEAAEDHSTGF
jgi:MFS family permease